MRGIFPGDKESQRGGVGLAGADFIGPANQPSGMGTAFLESSHSPDAFRK